MAGRNQVHEKSDMKLFNNSKHDFSPRHFINFHFLLCLVADFIHCFRMQLFAFCFHPLSLAHALSPIFILRTFSSYSQMEFGIYGK